MAPLQRAESIQNTPGAGLRKKSGLSRFAVATNTCPGASRWRHTHDPPVRHPHLQRGAVSLGLQCHICEPSESCREGLVYALPR